ncbi:MAG TPA: cytochrome c/FTR1 family iron permease, partial [Longimicrobium sp.]|nr:cytochrome c/FTR1 family iron permease [Longimicrobium sp.]
ADYPAAVESKSPFELEEQSAFIDEALAAAQELGPRAQAFVPRLERIRARVHKAEDPQGVSKECAELVEDLVLTGGLSRSPRRTPDLKNGAKLYAVSCAACHAADGSGQVEIAATMDPKPANFLDPERMNGLTPYKAFNALSFGITGTPMPAFSTLEEKERWDLAFYIFTLRQPDCGHTPARASLEELANAADPDLAAKYGDKEVSCLRRKLPDADEERSLLFARGSIEDAMKLSKEGKHTQARQAIIDAYLKGIEPVEPLLRSRDPRLVSDLEAAFGRTRLAAERGSPHVADEGRELLTLIDKARRSQPSAQDFLSVFWLALLILIREGFEATIVIAALLAVLKKMEQTRHARIVHAGWMSAVVVGALAFVFGRKLLAGENRELLEGVFALFAVVMLVYAALWLNARANIRKFMGELRTKMQGALGRGSAVGLFSIAFTAMLRESVETAIFLEGLSIDSPKGVAWGIAAGLAVLLGLVLFINRVGYKLPMKPLFNASTVLLLVTAVMMLGKGLHALQETGLIPLRPVPFIQVDALGIFPDAYSLVPQLLLALAPLLWWISQKRGTANPTAVLQE